ncbi:MAG TPA: hypothetical protein VJJ83_02645 [Candidatus Babeliales bacterium]|nr:hypothetical protein [Candidatus Babeliales bacterium]
MQKLLALAAVLVSVNGLIAYGNCPTGYMRNGNGECVKPLYGNGNIGGNPGTWGPK